MAHTSPPPSADRQPVVLAIDVGSSGTRAGLYDSSARPLGGPALRYGHHFETGADGSSTIGPDLVVDEIVRLLDHVLADWDGPVDGVALDTFASSLVGVSADGTAMTPCYTYADTRCATQVRELRQLLDEDEVHQRTGVRQHTSYLPPRLLWIRQTQPDTFAEVAHWMSLGEYVWLRLLGHTAAGVSTAAWTGLLDRHTLAWDPDLCALVGIRPSQLSPIAPPSAPLSPLSDIAGRWPQLKGALWFAPIADGHAQTLGVGCTDSTRRVLSAATSGAVRVLVDGCGTVPSGLWCYPIDEGTSLLGGALSDVRRAVTWLESTLRLPDATVVANVLGGDPLPDLPVVLPWFSGERSTGWATSARAAFTGVSAATTPLELYRATVESVAWAFGRILTELDRAAPPPEQLVATGRASADLPGLLQMVADASGVPVVPLLMPRSTLRGTALHALLVLAPDGAPSPVPLGNPFMPVGPRRPYYEARARQLDELHRHLVSREG